MASTCCLTWCFAQEWEKDLKSYHIMTISPLVMITWLSTTCLQRVYNVITIGHGCERIHLHPALAPLSWPKKGWTVWVSKSSPPCVTRQRLHFRSRSCCDFRAQLLADAASHQWLVPNYPSDQPELFDSFLTGILCSYLHCIKQIWTIFKTYSKLTCTAKFDLSHSIWLNKWIHMAPGYISRVVRYIIDSRSANQITACLGFLWRRLFSVLSIFHLFDLR